MQTWWKRHARWHAALAVAMLAWGCAGTSQPPPQPPVKDQLLAAGFRVVVAATEAQRAQLQSLPPGAITEWQRTGKRYFVYPDTTGSRLYVGTPKEYAAYLSLAPGAGAASPSPQAADLASYNRQDSAMQRYTNRDLADPYYFWDSFDGLGWR